MTESVAKPAPPEENGRSPSDGETSESPRVVYVQAPVLLGTLQERTAEGWLTRFGTQERVLPAEDTVDPALLLAALDRGAPVLIDQSEAPVIVGVVATQRSVVIDERGEVDVEVERFAVSARREILMKTPGAYLRAKKRDIEVYGNKVLTRGRELAKTLAAMIEFN